MSHVCTMALGFQSKHPRSLVKGSLTCTAVRVSYQTPSLLPCVPFQCCEITWIHFWIYQHVKENVCSVLRYTWYTLNILKIWSAHWSVVTTHTVALPGCTSRIVRVAIARKVFRFWIDRYKRIRAHLIGWKIDKRNLIGSSHNNPKRFATLHSTK
jgi:hypothetical protein